MLPYMRALCLMLALSVWKSQASTASTDDLQRAQPMKTFIPQWLAKNKLTAGTLHWERSSSDIGGPSYGQDDVDLITESRFFHKLHKGTFLELGALDGKLYSNTKLLEEERGWRGVLVEPNKEEFDKIPMNRPEAIAVHAAICAQNQDVHFISKRTHHQESESAGGVAGIWEFMPDSFRRNWYGTEVMPQTAEAVPCVSLGSILQTFSISHIDFFSLDVEGAELEVLRTLDLSAVRFNIIVVEQDGLDPTKDEAVRELLLAHDFELYVDEALRETVAGSRNDWFVNKHFKPSKAPA